MLLFMFMNAKQKPLKGKINERLPPPTARHRMLSIFQSINPLRIDAQILLGTKTSVGRKIEKPPRRLDSSVRADV
jgi:hypothetical protein